MDLLKLEKDDFQKELEFEVKCALQISPEERLARWFDWNIQMLEFAQQQKKLLNPQHGHEDSSQIVKRT